MFFAGVTYNPNSDITLLEEIDTIISTYIQSILEEYATALMNKLISNAGIDTFCAKGICYYATCEHSNCKILYCNYRILTNEEKCSINKPSGKFEFNLQDNRIPLLIENEMKLHSYNLEDNNLKIVKRIISK